MNLLENSRVKFLDFGTRNAPARRRLSDPHKMEIWGLALGLQREREEGAGAKELAGMACVLRQAISLLVKQLNDVYIYVSQVLCKLITKGRPCTLA